MKNHCNASRTQLIRFLRSLLSLRTLVSRFVMQQKDTCYTQNLLTFKSRTNATKQLIKNCKLLIKFIKTLITSLAKHFVLNIKDQLGRS